MVSKLKLYTKLDSLEHELRESLIPHLNKAANGENDLIFCVIQFNPFSKLKSKTDKKTEQLVDIAAQILVLKDKLDEPSRGSIAERICWYCRQWADTKGDYRKNAPGLAKQFLDEIESNR